MIKVNQKIKEFLTLEKKTETSGSCVLIEDCQDYEPDLYAYGIYLKEEDKEKVESFIITKEKEAYAQHCIRLLHANPEKILDYIKKEHHITSYTALLLCEMGKQFILQNPPGTILKRASLGALLEEGRQSK